MVFDLQSSIIEIVTETFPIMADVNNREKMRGTTPRVDIMK